VQEKKINILVVEDSAFMRLLISDILSEDDDLQVIGTANNGLDAVDKVSKLKPDLVLLDMEMGEYDGLFAVREIMKVNPLPIIILSALGNTNLEPIFEALKAGAIDYINKPKKSNSKMRLMNVELIQKIKSVFYAKPKFTDRKSKTVKAKRNKDNQAEKYEIIVIGASTGGPSALEEIITTLPDDLNVPVLICQHMPDSFIQPFVNRLDSLTELNVVMGEAGMMPKAGKIIIAPGHSNMVVKTDKSTEKIIVGFDDKKYSEFNNPSINALMLSVAREYGAKSIGVILTGMGKDGVEGLKAIKEAGGLTVAQNKETSVIYGMPKVAMEQNAASHSLDIKDVSEFITNHL